MESKRNGKTGGSRFLGRRVSAKKAPAGKMHKELQNNSPTQAGGQTGNGNALQDNNMPSGSAMSEGDLAMDREVAMSVSGICGEGDDRYAFVQFSGEGKFCEFKFPKVELKLNNGFSEEELVQMRFYVKNHIPELKQMAASINPFRAILG